MSSPENMPNRPTDAEILAYADMQWTADVDLRLSVLLDRQQSGLLCGEEVEELNTLMETYKLLLLLKARALREAVHRGLRGPLEP